MCKHKEKWPCLRTATPQPPACAQPWRVKPKGRACVWVCVSQVLGGMVEVKANIPLAVRAAWPVCYSPYVHLFCSLWDYVVVYRTRSWSACCNSHSLVCQTDGGKKCEQCDMFLFSHMSWCKKKKKMLLLSLTAGFWWASINSAVI